MLQSVGLIFGIITTVLSLILFIISFVRRFQEYDVISAESLRLVSGLQFLGGFLSVAGSQTQFLIPAYAYIIVGVSLIIISWAMLNGLRTPRSKRKQKSDD